MIGIEWSIVILMIVVFAGFMLGVRLLEFAADKLDSITFIKSVHTIIFVPLSGLLFIFAYEVAVNHTTSFTWVAIATFLAEGVALVMNNGQCPLTKYAERLGSEHGQITDFFFPKWFADHIFQIYTGVFMISLIVLVIRLLR